MKKKIMMCLFVIILITILTGCSRKDKTENFKEETNINSEITEYIKKTFKDTWEYSSKKYKIDNNHAIEIVLNNVEDWSYCAYNSNKLVVRLNENNKKFLKEIPSITFICKNNGTIVAKTIYENIYLIRKDNVEENAKYYDLNNNIINEKVEEGFKKTCVTYKYKEIFRNPDLYLYKRIKVTGEVIQVMEEQIDGKYYWVLRVNMTKDRYGYYEDTIMVMIEKSAVRGRIIEDDIFSFYGLIIEPITYDTVLGASQTVPAMLAYYGDLKN